MPRVTDGSAQGPAKSIRDVMVHDLARERAMAATIPLVLFRDPPNEKSPRQEDDGHAVRSRAISFATRDR